MAKLKSLVLPEKDALRAATIANKKLLRYVREHGISIYEIPLLSLKDPYLSDLLKTIQIGRMISQNQKYIKFRNKVKVHPLKTRRGLSAKAKQRLKAKAEAKRNKLIFEYPEIGRPLEDEEKAYYRTLLIKNLNSGMAREKAISITNSKFFKLIKDVGSID